MFPGDEFVPKQMHEEAALSGAGKNTDISEFKLPRDSNMLVTQIKKHHLSAIYSS